MVCFLPAPQSPAEHPRHAGLLRGPSARPAPPGSLSGLRESSRGCPTRRRCHTRGTWHGTGVETAAALRDGARSSRPAAGARPALSQAPGSGVAMAGICKRKGRRAWHGGGVRHRSSTKAMPGSTLLRATEAWWARPRSCWGRGLSFRPWAAWRPLAAGSETLQTAALGCSWRGKVSPQL